MEMEVPTVQELDSLKYADLQKLAKTVGLKANLKADKLLKSLKQHFLHEPKGEHEQDAESSQSSITLTDEDELNSSQEKEHVTVAHVTKRRRGRKVEAIDRHPKTKVNVDTPITNDVKPSEEQHKAICEDKVNNQSKEISVKGNRKRRRPEDETGPEIQTNDALTPGGKLPKLVGRHLKLGNSGTKPTTPNFKKLHEAHFKKMESIDTFVERNKKRLEALSNPNQVIKSTLAVRKENTEDKMKNSGKPEIPKCTEDFKAGQGTEDTVTESVNEKPTDGNSVKSSPSKNVPRYERHLSRPADSQLEAITPNLKKLKASHFEKMSLLDEYLDRKKERLNAITNSIQEVKMLADKKTVLKQGGKKVSVSNLKKNGNSVALFSPVPARNRHSIIGTPASQRRSPRTSVNLANLSLLTEKATFKPSVLSSSKMNVRFSETTKDNEHKRSLIKTPARRSPYVHIETDTPNNEQMKGNPIRKSFGKPLDLEPVLEKRKTGDFTPFKFMGEKAETPNTIKKSFDIKASLARPLSYEPHKGKLKPWNDGNENSRSVTKSMNRGLSSLKKDYKQPHLQTREARRDEHVKGRKAKKDEAIGTRRGIIMT
ncbi:nucleolar and spindle-associated protein 1 [Lissotriton helveticus]